MQPATVFRRVALGLFPCLLLAAALPCPAATPSEYRWWQPVLRENADREEVVAVPLGNDIYENTRDDLADVRVFDREDREVPFVLEKATFRRSALVQETAPTQVVSLENLADNLIEVIVRQTAAGPMPPSRLSIQTPLHDFDKRVSVWGSRDRGEWTLLAEDRPIFDYRRFMDVRRTDVDFEARDFAFYKVSIRNVTDVTASPFVEFSRERRDDKTVSEFDRTVLQRRDFRVDSLTFWRFVKRDNAPDDRTAEYPVADLTAKVDAGARRTELLVRTARQPLCGVRILTASHNFSRGVTVQTRSSEPGAEWAGIGGGTIADLSFGPYVSSELAVSFPERRVDALRLLIDNGDSPPLDITGVQLTGKVYQVRFLAARENQYRVFFGRDDDARPAYDAAAVLARIPEATAPHDLALGDKAENPDWSKPRFGFGRLLEKQGVLPVVLVAMVLVLGLGIWQAARRIGRLPEAPPPKA